MATLKVNNETIEIAPANLPYATNLAKGAVKQGAGVAKDPYPEDAVSEKLNDTISSLRYAGVIANDKFIIMYERNYPQGVDEGGNFPIDDHIYMAGDTANIRWGIDEGSPYCSGYNFKGWATSPDAVTPTYPYDESDPQTYTVTFTNDDIILYAVWEAVTVTITYSIGDYGTGSVPSPQTVAEGDEVEISFSPTPTVNDGSGRVFVGWSERDGENSFYDATYRSDGTNYMYPYSDVTLYPVFCAQYTLTYALGNDGTGSVPSAVTGYNGQNISVTFSPAPTCVSDPTKSFLGWATSDEQSSATYPVGGMMTTMYMTGNVTLYPAFGVPVTRTLTYVLGDYATGSVPSPAQGTDIMGGMVTQYNLSFSPAPTCTRAGTWDFIGWAISDGQTTATYPIGTGTATKSPAGDLTLYPAFEEVQVGGTIDVVNNSSYTISVTRNGISYDSISANSTKSITIEPSGGYEFEVSYVSATFTGTYNGVSYTEQSLTYSDKNGLIQTPLNENTWLVQSGDGGTLTVED